MTEKFTHEAEYSNIIDKKITSVVILIINNEGKVLVFARDNSENRLGLIAGKREITKNDGLPSESIQSAANRELFEETGLGNLINANSDPFFISHPATGVADYCATFVIEFDQIGPFPLENSVQSEGYAFWANPNVLIDPQRGAFIEYNTQLLKKVGLLS